MTEPPSEIFVAAQERMLQSQLQRDPSNQTARLQLLEIYYQAGREEDFLREAKVYRSALRGNLDTTDWKMVQSIGLRLFPESPLFREVPDETHRRLGETAVARPHLDELAKGYEKLRDDAGFLDEFDRELIFVADRPTPLLHARRLSESLGGAQIYFKREDRAQSGAHLQIHVVGQALLAKRLGRKTLVTGTIYGQRGVVMAEVAARLGLGAVVYMDAAHIAREPANVFRMWLMGADVQSIDSARLPEQDVRKAALAHWLRTPHESLLVMGLDWGPDPYPLLARGFSAVIGREVRRQCLAHTRRQPDLLVARAGDNPDAIGFMLPFIDDPRVRLACVQGSSELAGSSPSQTPQPAAALSEQQRRLSEAILEGMEYLSVSREHGWLRDTGRVEYHAGSAEAARAIIGTLSRLEGLVSPIDSAHALAWACDQARRMRPDQVIVVALCERADKDIFKIGNAMGVPL